jgi:hypothetical protein
MSQKTMLTVGDLTFRDLNKNGRRDPYEDPRLPIEERVEDLLAQMTLEEKAGMMFHPIMQMGEDGSLVEGGSMFGPFSTSEMVVAKLINHFNILRGGDPRIMAEWHNRLQELAERTRLGIPVTISGEVVESPEQAELAILRLKAPFEQRDGNFIERLFHAGDLDFQEPEKSRVLGIVSKLPTVVDIYLDRAAVIPELAANAAALLANFGANDAAVLDVIFGRSAPSGKLPFELPSSMEAVRRQKSDVPYDSENPLFPFGYGLTY